jgi:hypothetical protein
MLGALGGVLLPLAWVPLQAATGTPRVVFAVLLGLTVVSAGWYVLGVLASRRGAGVVHAVVHEHVGAVR